MDLKRVEEIADAVLYEGYMLYPYRPSAVKNQQRFNFGVLYPQPYCEQMRGAEAWEQHTECLVRGNANTSLEVKIRFLQMATRQGWQEGLEREVTTRAFTLGAGHQTDTFTLPGSADHEGRRSETLHGEWELRATLLGENVFKLALTIRNIAQTESLGVRTREEELLESMVSVHSILRLTGGNVTDGEFISLLDPPAGLKLAAAECRNTGVWPVLVGEEGQRDLMLSAPIILYDYPQIAPESSGDLFDGTEIDEILALRILTMTDEEKREMRRSDDRARRILERTETLPPEHFQKLHGALRQLRPEDSLSLKEPEASR